MDAGKSPSFFNVYKRTWYLQLKLLVAVLLLLRLQAASNDYWLLLHVQFARLVLPHDLERHVPRPEAGLVFREAEEANGLLD